MLVQAVNGLSLYNNTLLEIRNYLNDGIAKNIVIIYWDNNDNEGEINTQVTNVKYVNLPFKKLYVKQTDNGVALHLAKFAISGVDKLIDKEYGLENTSFFFDPTIEPSYIIFQKSGIIYAKNGRTGQIDFVGTDAATVIQQAINNTPDNGLIYFSGSFTFSSKPIIKSRNRLKILGDAIISGTGFRIEDSFMTKIDGIKFLNCDVGIEIASVSIFSEHTILNNFYFDNCSIAIAFRTPTGTGTGSYVNTHISDIGIELRNAGNKGIVVERNANIGDSLFENLHIWHHVDNTIGLDFNGLGNGAVIVRPTFESFVSSPTSLYGINIGQYAQYPPYLIRPSWLGSFTSKIYNPYAVWLQGLISTIMDSKSIPLGLNGSYGNVVVVLENRQGTGIAKPIVRIDVGGTFGTGETVYVKIIFEYVDGSQTSLESGPWTSTGGYTLSDTDLLNLLASSNIIWAIKAQAKTNLSSTSAIVTVKVAGFG